MLKSTHGGEILGPSAATVAGWLGLPVDGELTCHLSGWTREELQRRTIRVTAIATLTLVLAGLIPFVVADQPRSWQWGGTILMFALLASALRIGLAHQQALVEHQRTRGVLRVWPSHLRLVRHGLLRDFAWSDIRAVEPLRRQGGEIWYRVHVGDTTFDLAAVGEGRRVLKAANRAAKSR